MAQYIKSTDFAVKDGLITGDPLKIVTGTEINDELNAIQVAVNSKADLNSPTLTGVPLAPTASPGTNTTQIATSAFVTNAIATATGNLGTMSTQNANAVAITGGTINGTTVGATTASTVRGTTITATTGFVGNITGNVTGNASTSTKLTTASGSAPSYSARAWVNFNGALTPPTIRSSGNVSSVVRTATGVFTINFTTAMPDANYSMSGSSSGVKGATSTIATMIFDDAATNSTTQCFIIAKDTNGSGGYNQPQNGITIFR